MASGLYLPGQRLGGSLGRCDAVSSSSSSSAPSSSSNGAGLSSSSLATPTGWHPLDAPAIWKGTEEQAVFRQATPYPLTPSWKVILLSDGSVTRHLQLMTNQRVEVECLEMRNIGHERAGLPPATAQIPGPLVQRQVMLHIPDPHSKAYVYATSWWNADTVDQYLRDRSQPIWVSLSQGRTELYRDILQLELGNCPYLEERFQAKGPFWGRQYLFWHNQEPLTLIYEVFSTALEEFLGPQRQHPPYTDSHGIPLLATDAVSESSQAMMVGPAHLGLGPSPPYTDSHGIPLLATDAVSDMEKKGLRDQLEAQAREIARLQGTLAHYRNWAAQLQARYQLFNPDAARPAKRVYVGNLPGSVSETELRQAINELMVQTGGTAAPGFPITSCKLYQGNGDLLFNGVHQVQDKGYAFVEFRSVEEASNAMALDGVKFRDAFLKIRRPNNYDITLALMLGPTDPNPAMDLAGLEVVKTVVQDSPHKLFIGGLPCDWSEEQVKEMLLPFGQLKAFNLVMDRGTGNSKGYAFAEFMDVHVTDIVIQNLNGKPCNTKFLTVKRALAPTPF
ncbi:chorismate lyase isoform B [Chlorella sorokiniana]|uniref:Chorismate lyase isoform B n=1 Tax=Chlorella sorokiniana TaxID=3076 RepID=A0A2P6TN32_CHLSO|nr:chorismate lyase isoform B [Chlorella sorokiniana]|eukprot:PRW45747.1 chorismate lyase isoform B [Chlorella sorokiniana]